MAEAGQRFDLGLVHPDAPLPPPTIDPDRTAQAWLAGHDIGVWECDLRDNALIWSTAVYDVMGFPRGVAACRTASVTLYREGSRAAMERLRAHAIKYRRGFTLDVELQPVGGLPRWMRLSAVSVCDGKRVTALRGLKQDISREYR